jgi:hypothetical protein
VFRVRFVGAALAIEGDQDAVFFHMINKEGLENEYEVRRHPRIRHLIEAKVFMSFAGTPDFRTLSSWAH